VFLSERVRGFMRGIFINSSVISYKSIFCIRCLLRNTVFLSKRVHGFTRAILINSFVNSYKLTFLLNVCFAKFDVYGTLLNDSFANLTFRVRF
jgi:hypothetical protein